ncbi:MAG: hypothetical protein GWN67_08320 [Phycisphaerae bacterium]|nr:hypothetical protein [Phycisphaerae bacterium]NIR64805.1 hypothetical protein [candidate division Zixibacteria bacterium]NIP53980.1 hypothetical protein [Phycisphaerae bacterium]NIS53876.1 hypothetical protein [Phycisphaerae bacterium]NIU10393.1 hypothetical protein [Phycisphaerae bacterium]
MAGNSPKKKASPLPIIAILAVLVGTAYVTRSPLESARPKAPVDLRHAVREEDKIEARLWQDPLRVALDHARSLHAKVEDSNTRPLCSSKHDVNDVREQIYSLTGGKDGDPALVHVLLVMIRGGITAEDHERRLRNRYAVHTALHSSGLVPEDTKHIQYFKLPWAEKEELKKGIQEGNVPKILKCDNENSNPLVVPFEWFRRGALSPITKIKWYDERRPENVLVVWLAESAFLYHPVIRLSQVIDALGQSNNNDAQIDVIGPSHSGTLRTMLSEIEPIHDSNFNNENYVKVDSILDGLKIYSPWSTVSPPLLVEDWHGQDPNGDSITEIYRVIPKRFASIGIEFSRMIGTDDLLAMHLIQELRRRGVDVIGKKGHVALITEWDTFYGKAFPLTFARMMESIDPKLPYKDPNWFEYAMKLKQKDNFGEGYFKENLHIFSYFQGIDGRLTGSETSTGQTSNEDGESELTLTKSPELPMGRSQLDYIRQLARKLDDEYEVKAFGVVGTDVYDKQLLIHALREELGCVIVFTLDLDTRMLHSGQCKWTRNVIVASHYGLELNKKYQGVKYDYAERSVPPFRDNYQTSLYFTCRKALGLSSHTGESKFDISWEQMIKAITHPRLFEIGRECVVDLSVGDGDIHPPRPKIEFSSVLMFNLAWIFAAVAFCILLLAYISTDVRKVMDAVNKMGQGRIGFVAKLFFVFVVLFVIIVIIDNNRPEGESFSLSDGVSIWPGEALRLIVGILSICFIAKSLKDLRDKEVSLCKEFLFKKHEEMPTVSFLRWYKSNKAFKVSKKRRFFGLFDFIKSWLIFYSRIDIHGLKIKKHRVNAERLWKLYLIRGGICNRFHRLIPMVLTYILLATTLMLMLGFPHTPYRGTVSFLADKLLLIFSVISLIILIFFVVDATTLSLKFIRSLKEPVTGWPKRLVDRFKDDETTGPGGARSLKETDGLAEWLDMKFIASHTETVGKLIYYPFIVLLLMFLSRIRCFDNWDFPISLIIIFLVNFTYALLCAMMLRHEAEKARRLALDRLQRKLVEATCAGLEKRSRQLGTMIEEIKSLQRGAFSSFLENPVMHVLVGSGGAGLLALLKLPLF